MLGRNHRQPRQVMQEELILEELIGVGPITIVGTADSGPWGDFMAPTDETPEQTAENIRRGLTINAELETATSAVKARFEESGLSHVEFLHILLAEHYADNPEILTKIQHSADKISVNPTHLQ